MREEGHRFFFFSFFPSYFFSHLRHFVHPLETTVSCLRHVLYPIPGLNAEREITNKAVMFLFSLFSFPFFFLAYLSPSAPVGQRA